MKATKRELHEIIDEKEKVIEELRVEKESANKKDEQLISLFREFNEKTVEGKASAIYGIAPHTHFYTKEGMLEQERHYTVSENESRHHIPVYYGYQMSATDMREFILGFGGKGATIKTLIIKDEDGAHQLIIDILRKTGCSIKEENGKLVIFKEKSDIDQKYDIYVEECVE